MLIDFHTHAFPDSLAERAIASLRVHIDAVPHTDGTIGDLIRTMDESGTDRSVVCNIATNARQVTHVNDFAIDTLRRYGDCITPLGSIHPDYEKPYEEIERLRAAGIDGLKIHPDYMRTMIDDDAFDPIFDAAADAGMFLVTHTGIDVAYPDKIHATPDEILNRLKRSPKAVLVAAHFGQNFRPLDALEKLAGQELYLDVSLCALAKVPKDVAAAILLKHDSDRLLFGTDCPWATQRDTFEYVDSLPIPTGLKEKIFWRNAARLLGL